MNIFSALLYVVSGSSTYLNVATLIMLSIYSAFRLRERGFEVRSDINKMLFYSLVALLSLLYCFVTSDSDAVFGLVRVLVLIFFGFVFFDFIIRNVICAQGSWFLTSLLVLLLGLDIMSMIPWFGSFFSGYKSIVQIEAISNLERESQLGLFGSRYFGFFAEPSYHATWTGALVTLLYILGFRLRAFFFFNISFLLCPSPFLFAFPLLILPYMHRSLLRRFGFMTVFSAIAVVVNIDRIVGLISSFSNLGAPELTSGTLRFVFPILALLSYSDTFYLYPSESLGCYSNQLCSYDLYRLPLVSFLIFFGLPVYIAIIFLVSKLAKLSFITVFIVFILASLVSGGGGFSFQFFGIVYAMLACVAISQKRVYYGVHKYV